MELYESYGYPFTGRKLERVKAFLLANGLDYDEGIEATVCLEDENGAIAATCSLAGKVLKCAAVAPAFQGQGLSARVLTLTVNIAQQNGQDHLFLFTKPKNLPLFGDLGFYAIAQTDSVLLMENRKNGISDYVSSLQKGHGVQGAAVMNCNPFTKGHRYLIEQASQRCDTLHVFILSEDKSYFPTDVRYELVRRGTEDIRNLLLHETSDYMVSSAVFPTYFIKNKASAKQANARLDLEIFGKIIAPALNITMRFVGTEPFCAVTNAYNEQMKQLLPPLGIEVIELCRLEAGGRAISATDVRRWVELKEWDRVKSAVPDTTYRYLTEEMKR